MLKNIRRFGILIALGLLMAGCGADIGEEVNTCDGTLRINIGEVADAIEDGPIGSISAEASGGSGSYSFSIDGVNFQPSNKITDLASGNYTVTVRDGNGCTSTATAFVPEQLTVSYSLDIVPILQANCNIAQCHCDGNSLCFEEYSEVVRNQEGIRSRTSARAMPPDYSGKSLNDTEIEDIANWVYQGARNN